ncbi:FG-GAP-like repeat-containing protein [Flavobacteriaceae bacterium S356]|uniref:FG-GAP-like repeat-containing protein n=1 Tax=Asprobacillus argus TaxID=3076534 RepID=A0ABU3LDQ5_9FLAO|nr:FG-GAP-like repeat-containing protein [Flavobacteriaceae bacterium S356]
MKRALFVLALTMSTISWAQLSFLDQASTIGVGYSFGINSFHGGGVSFVDFDQDGKDDLTFATESTEKIHFFRNDGVVFTKISLPGIDQSTESKQLLWVDYDNDGDLDFFVTSTNGPNKLYQNDGSLSFTDVTSSSGLFTEDLNTFGACFGDIDKDGDLDLFITNRGITVEQRNYLYRNDNGTFVDITVAAGINISPEQSFCAAFFDYDNDGDQDIYVANDKFTNQNRFYKNNNDGTFDDVSTASGTDISIDAMSTTIGDYNNDGWFDMYITNTPNGNVLFKNNGDGTFTDVATSSGTIFSSTAWGAVFLDADLDSSLDLYVSGSMDGSNMSFLSSAFYHNNGSNVFSIPTGIGFDSEGNSSYSNAIGDFNNDGAPDIAVMNENANYYVWENQSVHNNNWIKIKLEGITGNKDGVGNRIEITANGKTQYRYTLCGEGYLGQNSMSEFVGVGTATIIDEIKIIWNHSGQTETITNIPVNQGITIQEGNGVLRTSEEHKVDFNVYPNPSSTGVFNIRMNESAIIKQLRVYDVSGRLLLSEDKVTEMNTIDLNRLRSGVYFAKITVGTASSTIKLIRN